MKASVVDVRYRMSEVLEALDRNEEVTLLYHGRVKGVIRPVEGGGGMRVKDHPFFNSLPRGRSVRKIMDDLRGGRHRAV